MSAHKGISRRQVLGLAVAGGSVVLFGSVRTVCAQAFRRTPDQIMGPFYPVVKGFPISSEKFYTVDYFS
jgi:hypothetical protein